ncbi:MAG TPA: tRNA 2-thiouridine(34) synthase MnmA [Desulfobacterales bacterium]|nr:tRNA 2-thiouridine(34) synthase MnmA [Desulfobacterales bacterium]
MNQLIAVAVSGGIDSLVAAHLLKEQGRRIVGIHFITGYETSPDFHVPKTVSTEDGIKNHPAAIDSAAASDLTSCFQDRLGIQVKVIDLRAEFKSSVVDYFIRTYRFGKTPNPCLVCNASIKFGALLDAAREMGSTCLATGHYARITNDEQGKFHLLKGADRGKDQSYFLGFLTQKQLAHAIFPLGEMTKNQVLQLANEKKLRPIRNRESQDVCFIQGKSYGEFLAQSSKIEPQPGMIEDLNGNPLGTHPGLHLFTVGQRRGIDCPSSAPYYVIRMDREKNRLVVGRRKDLLSSACRVEKINWINQEPTSPIKVHTKVRYRNEAVESVLFPIDGETVTVRFQNPQMAVTPGQGAMFYKEDELLGGGWIE